MVQEEATLDISVDGWADTACIASLVEGEPEEVLRDVDADVSWGRPATASRIAAASCRAARRAQFETAPHWQRGELRRHFLLTIYHRGKAVGFSECVIVSRYEDPNSEHRQCRICLETEGELLDACACRGSLRYICTECLMKQWASKGEQLSTLSNLTCTLCNTTFVGRAAELLGRGLRSATESKASASTSESTEERLQRHVAEVAAATSFWQQGKYEEAAELFRKAITGMEAVRGPDDANTLSAHHNLSLVLHGQGKLASAQTHVKIAREGFSKLYGKEHPLTLKAAHNDALIALALGRHQEALSGFKATHDARCRVLGAKHIDSLKSSCNLGLALVSSGDASQAKDVLQHTFSALEHTVGRNHPLALAALQNLSIAMAALEPKSEEALQFAREVCESRHRLLGPEHPETLEALRDYCATLTSAGQVAEAEEVGRRALKGMQRALGFEHSTTQNMFGRLRKLYEAQGKTGEAESLKKEYNSGIAVQAKEVPVPKQRGPTVAFILSLYVVPSCRRRGLGRLAMEHWKAVARENSATAVELCIEPASASLPFFTGAIGMREVDRHSASWPDDGTSRLVVRLRYSL
eukprot:gnl/TRDRNA2_/TRDRNA2_198376_c0_seq1.p1 gnl/TRDRNA2_/TRDRNA2_198376_c0~~gnl/TRDRNA2_/TRDRNA2_198376_c0_seq1.p1  ORF type:complete len:584 (-),score=108.60 gnl/TRDRNA2_/TRDRNA2_198376_c0_seq1:71-1822(-)